MYNHRTERIADTNANINEAARQLFKGFVSTWSDRLDLSIPSSIVAAHEAATEAGIFTQAKKMRTYYFGSRLTTYGVNYVSDACVEGCAFCPAGIWNRGYKSKTLTTNEVVADVLCTMLQGHKRTCVLQANWSEEKFLAKLTEWLPEVIRVCAPLGLEELILNVQTLSQEGYRQVMELKNGVNPEFSIQIRTFQESYNSESYTTLIPRTPNGNKGNMTQRLQGQETASNAGVDAVGCGVLFGLNAKPLQELGALVHHAEGLLQQNINLVRICLPSAHEISGLRTRIPFDLSASDATYPLFSELVYALARLALPEMNWVMSERDPALLRDILAAYATETTVGVRPGVGDNLANYVNETKGLHFVQATTYSEIDPASYVERMNQLGFKVDLVLSESHLQDIKLALANLGY